MKVADLGLGQLNANQNTSSSIPTTNKKYRIFNLLSLFLLDTQRFTVISAISTVYSLFQNVFISFWPHLDLSQKDFIDEYDFVKIPLKYEENMTNVFFMYSTDKSADDLYTFSFVIFFVSVFFFILFLTCFFLNFFRKIVNYRLIHCFCIFYQFVCQIILVPLGFQTGFLILKILQMKSMQKVGESTETFGSIEIFTSLVVLNFVLYLVFVVFTVFINVFNSQSIIIVNSYMASYNGYFQSFVQIFPSIVLFFSNVLPIFHKNIRFFIVLFHMIYCILSIIGCFWIPFHHFKINSVVASVCLSMLISDFLSFTKLSTKWYKYLIFVGMFVVLFFLFDFFLKLRVNFIFKNYKSREEANEDVMNSKNLSKKMLNSNPAVNQSYNNFAVAPTGFEDLPIQKALFALRVALISKNNIFLDGRLIELIATKAESDQDKIELACLICCFPEFQPIFFAIITGLKRVQFLPILKDFQLFQLRCYDTSCHIDSKVDRVKEVVHESSALSINLRSFWQLIDSECDSSIDKKNKLKVNLFTIFDRFSRSIDNCKDKWTSIITLYPNNIEIADEYSKFLIEFCGDFIGASEWKTVSLQMREGKIFRLNPFVVSFLKVHPSYFRQIIDKQSLIKNFDDIDIYKKIENVGNLIEMPEARFEFQRAASSFFPLALYIFLILITIPLLFIVIFWIVGFSSFNNFEHVIDEMYYIINTGLLAQQISKNFVSAILDYGQLPSVGVAPTPEEIFATLYENNESDRVDTKKARSLIPITGEYKSSLSAVSERGMGLIDYLHNSTLDQIEKSNNFQIVLDSFYSNTLESSYYLSKEKKITSTSNLQSSLISFFTYYFTMSYDYNYSYINDTECYHASMAGSKVLDRIDIISQSCIQNSRLLFNNEKKIYSTGIYVTSAIYIVISCIAIWIDIFFIIRHFKNICNSLIYFPKSVKQKAGNSIFNDKSDKIENPEVNESAIKNMKSKMNNFVILSLVIISIINIGLGATILSFHFYYERFKKNFMAISESAHFYSINTAQIIEVLFAVMAANTFGRVVTSVDSTFKERLTTTIEKYESTYHSTKSYSFEGECGIRGNYLDILNNLLINQRCDDFPDKTQHEILSCLNFESMVNAYIDLARDLEGDVDDPLLLKKSTFKQFIHFSLSHIYYESRNFASYLTFAAMEKVDIFDRYIKIYGAISISVACIVFLMNIFLYTKIRSIYRLLFVFISRVLPSDIVNNSELLSTLLGIKNLNKAKIENSGTSFIVQESSSPIIFIDRSTLIEFVNTAFTNTFGIEPNFIVGQPISRIITGDEVLNLIDTIKFFGAKKIPVKTVYCVKRNGNKAPFEITIVPISEFKKEKANIINQEQKTQTDKDNQDEDSDDSINDSFIHRLAIILVDKTTKKNLKRKCSILRSSNDKIINSVYPQIFQLYYNGYFRMCAICLIKFSNTSSSGKDLLMQRQNMYQLLYEKLSIFPLLLPLDCRNGIFAVVGCKKNDPTELAIECLNFVFKIIDEFSGLIKQNNKLIDLGFVLNCPFNAVIETGGQLEIGWTGNNLMKTVISGELMNRALNVLDFASSVGNVCVSNITYEFIMQHDYSFAEKEIPIEIGGKKCIYAISIKNINTFYPSKSGNTSESDSNVVTSDSLNFIEKLREDEPYLSQKDE